MAMAEHPKPDFGMKMKRAREDRGVSLRKIADTTKLSVSALEALERNDIARLPGGIFSRAFVRSYAIEVGLDPEQTVRDFLVQFPHDFVTAGSPHAPQEDLETGARFGSRAVVASVVAVAVLIAVVMFFMFVARP